jgi:diacylglycerol kinase (ATP)
MDAFVISIIAIFLILLFIAIHQYAKPTVRINGKKRHSWKNKVNIQNSTHFCQVCELLLSSSIGVFCEYCGVACDKGLCIKIADKKIKCKQQCERKEILPNEFTHCYVKGNLSSDKCRECRKEIENVHEPGIHGTRCIWCQGSFHDECADDSVCDFGKYKNFIIPPFAVKARRTRKSPKLHLTEITPIPEWKHWEPLIVIANTKSGSSEADEVAGNFRKVLNPMQVKDFTMHGPAEALEIVKLSPVKCRLLVAGGDGSVAWVLNTIQEMNLDDKVSVAICPIGTGNDLSRVMGWGAEIDEHDLVSADAIIEKIQRSERILLDRWLMQVKFDNRSMLSRRLHHDKKFFMYNYFSVGVDALVTYNFHKTRSSAFYIVKSKIINKFMYFIYGTHQVLVQDCDKLHQDIEVYLDEEKIELPELQSVVVLNIDSWGAGVKLVEMTKETDKTFSELHSTSDKLVEVFGVSSSFHIAQLQVGLTKPLKLGRAKEVKASIFSLKVLSYVH